MARIIYKEGCKGQNRLECIEGIEIELLNGQNAVVYPKYSEEVMLPGENIKNYGQAPYTEIAALKETENECLTDELHDCGSPAAEFVHKFYSDKYGRFHLPTLIAAMELQDQKNDIDELAGTIEGTDRLRDFTSITWSCLMKSRITGWLASGNAGCSLDDGVYYSYLAVPVILY